MVGIVIVSHSAQLAAGVQELAQQMVQGSVLLAIAAGIEDPENPFGTDAMQVYQAIDSVYSDDGVVVLMDLGSAVLSAEMALEFLPEDQRAKVRLCEAPLVEGAIAAVVGAANGADLEQVLAEARGALAAKAAQLQMPVETTGASIVTTTSAREIRLTVRNQLGLHARPAAKFVAKAAQFQSQITVQNVTSSSSRVSAKSINQLATLGVRQGHEIVIAAEGADATDALAALQELVEANFGETGKGVGGVGGAEESWGESVQKDSLALTLSSPASPASPAPPALFCGIAASNGIAIGQAVLYHPQLSEVQNQLVDNPEAEWQQLQTAINTARQEIQTLRQKASGQVGEEEAAIFDAHLLCLEDPAVLDQARQLIFDHRLSAASAWKAVVDDTAAAYQTLEDPYLQARAADVMDVGQRVLRLLTGMAPAPLDLKEPAILVANDLTPSDVAQLDPNLVLGICTGGSATSHACVLARGLGIPAVVGVGAELLHLENGTLIALDGATGQVWVQPDDAQLKELQRQRDSQLAAQQTTRAAARAPAITRDGRKVKVMANIQGVAGAQVAVDAGAEGVGLLRSEFLYLERAMPHGYRFATAPTENEQIEVYQAIAQVLGTRPLTIRTLDIGGDKPLPYLDLGQEANPFLGWRGIRLLLDYPDLLKTQLRAILRTSAEHQIKVMFPMIATAREVRAAKEILATAQTELRSDGIPFDEAMEVGIMVEVPAAVTMAEQLAAEVDFFSIGTNDLSQYVMAADRTNPKVATLADAFEPAVLRMIAQTVKAAHDAGIWVGVCGELASFPAATPILLGLGVDELSMSPSAIPAVKAAVSRLTMTEAEAIARAVLQLDSAEAVREYAVQKAGG